MPTDDHRHDQPPMGRIETFSDGVFAIAITLLIIEIGVPHLEAGDSLGEALADLWPSYGAYVLSFGTIGIWWANHHSFFRLFLRSDHFFLMLNVIFLASIAFVPFPTAVLGEYLSDDSERQAAVGFYVLGFLFPAIGWLAIWLYGNARGLVDERLHPGYVRLLTAQYAFSNAVYGSALLLSLWSAWLALGICVGLTLLYLVPPRRPKYID
jgi:uncharacterized membrane protein